MKELEKNPNVFRVTEQTITYHPNFKIKAVREYLKGKSPSQIFVERGFNLDVIGKACLEKIISMENKSTMNRRIGFIKDNSRKNKY